MNVKTGRKNNGHEQKITSLVIFSLLTKHSNFIKENVVNINNVKDLDEALDNAKSSMYPVYFLCVDGQVLSYEAVVESRSEIDDAINEPGSDPQWQLIAYDVNWENGNMVCAHTNKPIEPAYDVKS